MRQDNALPVTKRLLTISTFCHQLCPALLQALYLHLLLFSQSVPICCLFNCLTLVDLTLLPGGDTIWLLMAIKDKMRIRQKGQGEDKWDKIERRIWICLLWSVKEWRRVKEMEWWSRKERWVEEMKCKRKWTPSKQIWKDIKSKLNQLEQRVVREAINVKIRSQVAKVM